MVFVLGAIAMFCAGLVVGTLVEVRRQTNRATAKQGFGNPSWKLGYRAGVEEGFRQAAKLKG